MRRIISIVTLIIVGIVSYFGYEHYQLKKSEAQRQMFDVVMTEKMQTLYEVAQDWSKPVTMDVHDARLSGDYKVLSEFVLNYWLQNIETRNTYLRDLEAAKWNHVLDVNRLDIDRKQKFVETEQMLQAVRRIMTQYQRQNLADKQDALAKVKTLHIDPALQQPLQEKLEKNLKLDQESALIVLELQILDKTEQMFVLLKNNEWHKENGQIMLQKDAQVKQFNALYQDVLKLNKEIEQKKKQNAAEIEGEID
ncbi:MULTISPECIES: hypothetical protein [Acinetobacter]|uniref:Uncharacterized protein n=1 Tax=Acinetobacter piscicola TaxID=2006115 RepID=A0A7S6VTL2_9GAMM|nr:MULTISPECIES: hypothetical protein [Acinetobacter]MDM1757917.1 hypothetical protein [Acinetobacter sp. 256-1]MDM1761332.1 hypothetical protein [Acinetobacter sp. 251-1]QOW44694.1 hypothetical protein G0028_01575 [Acinetobacter piscicola]